MLWFPPAPHIEVSFTAESGPFCVRRSCAPGACVGFLSLSSHCRDLKVTLMDDSKPSGGLNVNVFVFVFLSVCL